MTRRILPLILLCSVLAPVGCRQKSVRTETAAPQGTAAEEWTGRPQLGSSLTSDGSIAPGTDGDRFAQGQPIHLSVPLRKLPPTGATLKVVWLGPDGTTIGEESKNLPGGEPRVVFNAQDTSSWKPGQYRVELWGQSHRVKTLSFDLTTRVTP